MKKVLVMVVLALFLSRLPAASPLVGNSTRTSPQDLEVTRLGADGAVSAPLFYSYQELSSLPQITVQTDKDPNTLAPATYTGILVSDLLAALGARPDQTVLTMNCYDHYQEFYDGDYDAKHKPIFLLKFDGKTPDLWPATDHNTAQGPYGVVHEKFVPSQKIYGYEEQPRIPFGVVSIRLMTHEQFFKSFRPKVRGDDLEVQKGYAIAMGSCISCHNVGANGGNLAQRPWSLLGIFATTDSDHFRNYVVNPMQFNPTSKMPAHPTFDAQTLDALQAYFKTQAPADE